jgi:hypothetical protein
MLDRLFSTRIVADGADLDGILRWQSDPMISGIHHATDPDVEGGTDGVRRLRRAPASSGSLDSPISFEVFADDAARFAVRRA